MAAASRTLIWATRVRASDGAAQAMTSSASKRAQHPRRMDGMRCARSCASTHVWTVRRGCIVSVADRLGEDFRHRGLHTRLGFEQVAFDACPEGRRRREESEAVRAPYRWRPALRCAVPIREEAR
jgi:hypothetical protein